MRVRRPVAVGDVDRYWNATREAWIVQVGSGGCYITNQPTVLTTVLGSCVAACVHDPARRIGGMNHFLLPLRVERAGMDELSTRYGVHAMEMLINEILKAGGRRKDLEVKLFGGAHVLVGGSDTGRMNIQFVRRYLAREGMSIKAEDLGGDRPRRIEFSPTTGDALVKKLSRTRAVPVARDENRYLGKLLARPPEGEIELF